MSAPTDVAPATLFPAAVLSEWRYRFIAACADPGDVDRTIAAASTWVAWLPRWVELGEEHERLADEAGTAGRLLTAAQARRSAALAYHAASFAWWLDAELRGRVAARAVRAFRSALPFLDPTAERIEVPFNDARLVGILRRPPDPTKPGLVILVPGLDSTKEELFEHSTTFIERGLACLLFEGPGQGEGGERLGIVPDYERPVASLLDALAGRTDLDLERVALVGVSLGGHYAPRAAAYEPRIKAVVSVSGPFSLLALLDGMGGLMETALLHRTGSADRDELRERLRPFDLSACAGAIVQPLLVVTGTDDVPIPCAETKRIAEAVPHAEFVAVEGGSHVCFNAVYRCRPLVADWVSEQLAGSAGA